jgi:hypothetical protein
MSEDNSITDAVNVSSPETSHARRLVASLLPVASAAEIVFPDDSRRCSTSNADVAGATARLTTLLLCSKRSRRQRATTADHLPAEGDLPHHPGVGAAPTRRRGEGAMVAPWFYGQERATPR